MKDIEIYKKRMGTTMTVEEKLFFTEQLNLFMFDCIVDFGGADGTLVHTLQLMYPQLADSTRFIIVDNNPAMETIYDIKNCTRVLSLDQITIDPSEKVLVIFSSVLHEVPQEMISKIGKFCNQYATAVSIRDMASDARPCSSVPYTYHDFENYIIFDKLWSDRYRERFIQHVERCVKWGYWEYQVIESFILKCDYVENWDTEVEENYLCGNCLALADTLCAYGWLCTYEKHYALPYKVAQAAREFGWQPLGNTHFKAILWNTARRA